MDDIMVKIKAKITVYSLPKDHNVLKMAMERSLHSKISLFSCQMQVLNKWIWQLMVQVATHQMQGKHYRRWSLQKALLHGHLASLQPQTVSL